MRRRLRAAGVQASSVSLRVRTLWDSSLDALALTCATEKWLSSASETTAVELVDPVPTYCVAFSAPALRKLLTISSRPPSRSTETNSMRGSLCSSTGGRREMAMIFVHSEELVLESASSRARPDTLLIKQELRASWMVSQVSRTNKSRRRTGVPVRAKDKCSAHTCCIVSGVETEKIGQSLEVAASAISFIIRCSILASDVNASSCV